MDEKLLGKCGFYCGACPTYIKGGCRGCEEEHTTGDCFTRDCVKEKKLNFCGECENRKSAKRSRSTGTTDRKP